MTEHIIEWVFAAIGGVSTVRFIVHKFFWVRQQYKAVLTLRASRRGYNIAYSQHQHPSNRSKRSKQPPVDPKLYTIPDDGNSK